MPDFGQHFDIQDLVDQISPGVLSLTERIELDVAEAGQKILILLHDTGFESALKQRSAAAVSMIETSDIKPPEILHQAGEAVNARWRDWQRPPRVARKSS